VATAAERVRLLRVARIAGAVGLLLLSGCQFIPPELRTFKSPIRLSPLKHEVTVQPAKGMDPAPFKIDHAKAGSAEVQLTISNPTSSTIRIAWTNGIFITADSISYAIGVKTDRDRFSTQPTTIEPNSTVQVTLVAIGKDGKPVVPVGKSIEAPFRVGLKVTAERGIMQWRGTVWVFVS